MHRVRVALTGATGFIGGALAAKLPKMGHDVRVLLRRPACVPFACPARIIGDLRAPQGLAEALAGAEVVIHAAALTAASTASEAEYRAVNTDATIALARAARRAGARRFIFLSSISAQAGTCAGEVLAEDGTPHPAGAYGRSKLAAEWGLSGLETDWVALRPVSVYGLQPQGKMRALLWLARSPLPLPFGDVRARRSLLFLDNLVSAVDHVIRYATPLRRPIIVAEHDPPTLPEIIIAMRQALARSPRIVAVPLPMLKAISALGGRTSEYQRFIEGSLVADPLRLFRLGWCPPIPTAQWIGEMARADPD